MFEPEDEYLDLVRESLGHFQKKVKLMQPTATPMESMIIAMTFELAILRQRVARLEMEKRA